mmetsp:Transcript_12916/g.38072  ORF Transcript_12916/g.38072 Transcript_12916/m.38072 type:complete len:188 (-) Transcript_12916:48-611(-)
MSAAAALELGPKLLAIVGVVACCVTALSCCILLAVMRNDKRRPLPRRAKEQEQEGLTRPSGGIGLSGNDEAPALGCCGSFLAALKTPPAYSWRQQADESAETVKYFLGCQTVLWVRLRHPPTRAAALLTLLASTASSCSSSDHQQHVQPAPHHACPVLAAEDHGLARRLRQRPFSRASDDVPPCQPA